MIDRRTLLTSMAGALAFGSGMAAPRAASPQSGGSRSRTTASAAERGALLWDYFIARLDAADAQRRARFAKLRMEDLPDLQARVRRTLLEGIGGLPQRTPLNARQTGVLTRSDYVIEKIIFESRPQYYVTANLYRPRSSSGGRPAVIESCGHNVDGKAAADYQRACIGLVKKGFVVLVYDPMGQGERLMYGGPPAGSREHKLAGEPCWLLGRTLAHYRIWDAIRALDYLETRPEVDKSRLGMFGHSGGGMLTLLTSPLDERLKAVMSSGAVTTFYHKTKALLIADPEQVVTGIYPNGVDHPELIAAVWPHAFLIGALLRDFVPLEGTRRTYQEVKPLLGDRVEMVESDDEHKLNRDLREACCRWMLKHLAGETAEVREPDLAIETAANLNCTETGCVMDLAEARSVFDLNREYARELARTRQGAPDLPALLAINEEEPAFDVPSALTPGTAGDLLLVVVAPKRQPALVRDLARSGLPVLELDLRGWGGTTPHMPEKKVGFSWDDFFAYRSFEMGRPLLGMRVRDLLAAIPRDKKVYLIGVEAGGVVALHAAAIDKSIAGVALVRSLGSYQQVFEQPARREPVSSFVPGALRHYDLPQLVRMIHPRPYLAASGPEDIFKGLRLNAHA